MNAPNENAPTWQGRRDENRNALRTPGHCIGSQYGLQSLANILARLQPAIDRLRSHPKQGIRS